MQLQEFSQYLNIWNGWVVLPAFTIAALILHIRENKISTRLIFIGLCFYLSGKIIIFFYKYQLSTIHICGLALGLVGLLFGIVGLIWYFRKDYIPKSKKK
jgi:FtsH-binding integral membrane protein